MRIVQYKTMLNDKGLPELVRENSRTIDCMKPDSPEVIAEMMRLAYAIDRQTEEYLYMVAFTTKIKPIGVFEISHGTIGDSLVSPREIFQKALMCGAYCIAIIHNHPSGEVEPSKEDMMIAARIKEAGTLMGVELTDSIIVGGSDYYSFRAKGLI